ncbi:protein artichoke-like [Lytechinus pictus]|uniref:protein artichoke-like n=1 Tax=Lytechinus pictus TaxID=7653 RepID=UPI0030B9EE35
MACTSLRSLMIVLITLASGVTACPENCNCYRNRLTWTNTMDCSEGGFHDIPSQLHPSIGELRMDNNFIREIKPGSLAGGSYLQVLSLTTNLIERVDPQGLSGLSNLRELTFAMNRIKDISFLSGTFLPALDSLILTRNPISIIPPSVFESLPNLRDFSLNKANLQDLTDARITAQRISVSENDIWRFGRDAFARPHEVRAIVCDRCAFRHLPYMGNLTALQVITLQNNRIATIDDAAFASFQSIETLDLTGNKITQVSSFRNLPTLRRLDLTENVISHIPSDSFEDIPKFEVLNLRSNHLTSYSCPVFIRQSLLLNGNDLKEFSGANLDLTTVLIINLMNNQNLRNVTIANATSLDYLYLCDCAIQNIELTDCPNLNYVNAQTNDLRSLSAFHDLPKMHYLILKNNFIDSIGENGLDGLPELYALDLSHNRFSAIPLLPELPLLTDLDLSYNKIESLTFEFVANLPNLKELILTGNRLKTIPVFPNIPFLETLTLSENGITYIEESPFDDLPTLTRLEMTDCNLTSMASLGPIPPLHLLILNQNQIREVDVGFLSSVPNLKLLNLANNEITFLPAALPTPSVNNLNFTNNAIAVIDNFAFIQCARMSSLDISNNLVETLDFMIYISSQSLWISVNYNKVRGFPVTGIPDNVAYLSLEGNKIETISPISFAFSSRLFWLSLAQNNIKHISSHSFVGCSLLSNINLGGNPLESIAGDAFMGLTELDFLQMENIPLPTFPETLFATLPNVMYINFRNMSAVITSLLHFPKMLSLTLGNQQMNSVPNITAPGLQSLDVSHSHLTRIPTKVFTNHPYVFVLRLSYNHIANINDGDFENANKLFEVSLDNNRIVSVAPGSFGPFIAVQAMNLQGNELTHLELGLSFPNTIQDIDLSGNPWHCDCHIEELKEVLMKQRDHMDPVYCASPPELTHQTITSLDISDLGCLNDNETETSSDLDNETINDVVTETVYDIVTEMEYELMTEVIDEVVTEEVVDLVTFVFIEDPDRGIDRSGDRDEVGPSYEEDGDTGDDGDDDDGSELSEVTTIPPAVNVTIGGSEDGESEETDDWYPPCPMGLPVCSGQVYKPSIYTIMIMTFSALGASSIF